MCVCEWEEVGGAKREADKVDMEASVLILMFWSGKYCKPQQAWK